MLLNKSYWLFSVAEKESSAWHAIWKTVQSKKYPVLSSKNKQNLTNATKRGHIG